MQDSGVAEKPTGPDLPIPWHWRLLGRFLSLKFCLLLSHLEHEALTVDVSALGQNEATASLGVTVPVNTVEMIPLHLAHEVRALRMASDQPVTARLRLVPVMLACKALDLSQLESLSIKAIKAHVRAIDQLGRRLWVGRVLSLAESRVRWARERITAQRAPVLPSDAPSLAVVRFTDDSFALAQAIDQSEADFVLLLDNRDRLLPEGVAFFRSALAGRPDAVLAYSDHAVANAEGDIIDIALKPGWNWLLQRESNYLGRACVFRREVLCGLMSALGSKPVSYQLLVSLIMEGLAPGQVAHLPELSFICAADDAAVASLPAAALDAQPLVSAVIPTRNGLGLLRRAVEALDKAEYRKTEIIIVDNGSDDPETLDYLRHFAERPQSKVIRDDGAFNFSRLMNRGFSVAQGSLLLSLNNDVEMVSPDWLGEMVAVTRDARIGVVGARLLYPDQTIQHAGFLLDGVNDHWYRHAPQDWQGSGGILAHRHLTAAVTGAVMLVTRAAWTSAGPFDEERFPVAFNDIDLCLRVRAAGFDVVYTPFACLIHHEAVSRGLDITDEQKQRSRREVAAFNARWAGQMSSGMMLSPHLLRQNWPMLP